MNPLGLKCDFCSGRPIMARYHAESFVVESVTVFESCGDWAACSKCEALIDAGNWDELVRRVRHSMFVLHPFHAVWSKPEEATRHYTAMYKKLRAANFRKEGKII